MRNSARLLSASAVSQLIAFCALPFIARLYSPQDLGTLSLFFSVAGMLNILANGKYEFAILLGENRQVAVSVFTLCLLINLCFSVLLLLVLFLFSAPLWKFLHYESLSGITFYLPLFIFITALGQACIYWFNYNKKFSLTAKYNLGQGIFGNGLKVGLGFLGLGLPGLVWANIGSHFIAIFACFLHKEGYVDLLNTSKKQIVEAARKFSNFPKYTLPHSFVNVLASNLPVLLLSGYFGMKEIGLFSMALTLCYRPINLLSYSFDQVISQKCAEKVSRRETIQEIVHSFCWKTLFVSLPAFLLVFILVPWLVSYFLSNEWSEVALYIRILLSWSFCSLFAASLSSMPGVFGKQRKALFIELILFVFRLLALLVGILMNSFVGAIILFSIVTTIMVTCQFAWFVWLVRKYEQSISS